MAGRRARTGRGWDAAPPRARRRPAPSTPDEGTAPYDWAAVPGFDGTDGPPPGATRHGAGHRADADPAGAPPGVPGRGAGRRRATGSPEGPPAPPVDPYERAREICLQQLSYRPRTRAELAGALRKKGVDDEVAAAVLDRYDEVGLIDDAAFARAWVASRHHGRGLARRALASELRQRGVDAGVVHDALEELDGETEAATARSLAERKLRGMSAVAPDAAFRRLVAMLARKGYPAGVAITAVKEALAAVGGDGLAEAEEIALAEAADASIDESR